VNLYEISRISVSWYEEHLWKISLQTNKRAKSYRVGVYTRQSAPGIFNWLTHICVVPHPVHLNVWRIYASFSNEGVKDLFQTFFGHFLDLTFPNDVPRSNTGTKIFNTIEVKLCQSWTKYYENACQKIKSGKLFSFSILTDQKKIFPDFSSVENSQIFSHAFKTP